MFKKICYSGWWTVVGYVALGAVIGFGVYLYIGVRKDLEMAARDAEILAEELEATEIEKEGLQQKVEEQQAIIDNFSGQISGIASTVGTLEKLAATDEELLKKYSRVYFLNENYMPANLIEIEEPYRFSGAGGNFYFHADVWPSLKKLLDAAKADGHELLVASAFRSFDTQAALKSSYKVTYGSGANAFSADQGYSEHQLGTSVDFTTPEAGAVFDKFGKDPAYEWLKNKAYLYGFVLSYPEGNSYYKFEPWHWRFVGRDLARYLQNEGKNFYDLDQREIDNYLVKFFD